MSAKVIDLDGHRPKFTDITVAYPELRTAPSQPRGDLDSVYLSGPMRGHEGFNYATFNEAANVLRAEGYRVSNPAESFEGDTTQPWSTYMRKDIGDLLNVDAVFVLPGWEESVGARIEVTVAAALDLPVIDFITRDVLDVTWLFYGSSAPDDKATEQENVLQTANRLVYGDRQKDYGHPAKDMARTAALWSVIFETEVTPLQVPLAMAALKISRELERHKADNLIDLAGYAAVAARVAGDD